MKSVYFTPLRHFIYEVGNFPFWCLLDLIPQGSAGNVQRGSVDYNGAVGT